MELATEIGFDTIVTQSRELVAADMDGEKFMLNIETGKYYGLDGIGGRIWEMIEKPQTVREVVAALLTEFDVEEKTCRHDVLTFLDKLYMQRLVAID